MTVIRRLTHVDKRRRIQVPLDQNLYRLVARLAREQEITLSRAAHELMERGARALHSPIPTATDSHGH